jgi:hypothetical protein
MKLINIYILRLKDNKYYIGKSYNPARRFYEHSKGNIINWTKKYKPVGIEKVLYGVDNYLLDLYVRKYMFTYGIDNVRGGSYINENLDIEILTLLNNELKNINETNVNPYDYLT